MQKVLFYNRTFFGGGAEKVLIDYIRGMDKRKFDITVMVRRDEGAFREQFLALEQEGVHIRRCCDWIQPGKSVFQKARNYILLSLADRCEFRHPRIFHRIAIREKYDVEIAFMHNEAAAIIASSPNKKSKKLLWVHTDLRRIDSWPMYFGTRKRQRRFFSKYDQIICVSEVARQSVEELLELTGNVMVLHNPVDREKILKMAQEPCPLPVVPVPTVCAVGRLSWEKNFQMLLHAHANLLKRGIEHRLCIVGEGPDRENLEQLICELGLKESVILAGHQSNPYPYIEAASFLVLSSVYEGYPTVVMEALVLGKPVVSSCATAQEVFGDYECGTITDSNPSALEDGMEKMLINMEYRHYCANQAVARSFELGLKKAVDSVTDMIVSK